jgi:predicted XRE-type DNA-binding protein
MRRQNAEREFRVTRGTGNVFADLGFADAAGRQAKLRLIHIVNQLLEARNLSHAAAAKTLAMTPSRLSALRRYKLTEFSVEALFDLLTVLDRDVEIVIRRQPQSRKRGRIRVVVAL